MPKITKYPRLRTIVNKNANGKARVYYFYDMRHEGKPPISLGTDYDAAVAKWEELHLKKPQTVGRLQQAFDQWRTDVLPNYTSDETRRGYTKNLRMIEPVFGGMLWDEVTLPILRQYLKKRSAKTQGNREMSVLQIIWSYALMEGMTSVPWPAAGVKNWKNEEHAREFEVTDELFNAVYAQGDQVLRDAMDIATATGMRLGDVNTVRMPVDGRLRFRANKTGKWAFFEVEQSPVLKSLIERRGNAPSVMLLTTHTGRSVSLRMLRDRYDDAREKAALLAEKAGQKALAKDIRAMFLRDMRKRASDLADDLHGASELLQHSSPGLTAKHYRTKAKKLVAVR